MLLPRIAPFFRVSMELLSTVGTEDGGTKSLREGSTIGFLGATYLFLSTVCNQAFVSFSLHINFKSWIIVVGI